MRETVRRLRYRLQRQGMCELEAWLAPLQAALETGDAAVIRAVGELLDQDVACLMAIMRGERPPPPALRPWLRARVDP